MESFIQPFGIFHISKSSFSKSKSAIQYSIMLFYSFKKISTFSNSLKFLLGSFILPFTLISACAGRKFGKIFGHCNNITVLNMVLITIVNPQCFMKSELDSKCATTFITCTLFLWIFVFIFYEALIPETYTNHF
jgi:hypothetical protein